MRKLVVLMAAMLIAAGALWSQAAAAPAGPTVTLNAVISYHGVWDLAAGKEYSDKPQFEIKWTWKPDDFTTAYLEFEEGTMGTADGKGFNTEDTSDFASNLATPAAIVDKAWFMSDVGKALKLPIGATVKVGVDEWNNKDAIMVTKSEWENFLGERDFRGWGAQIELVPAPMMTLRTQFAFDPSARDGSFKNLFMVGAYGTAAPVTYELAYFTNGNNANNPDREFGMGWLEAGAKFAQDISKDLNVAACVGFEYDMGDFDPVLGNPSWRVQFGAQALFQKMASLGLAWRGEEEATSGGLQVQGWAMPIKDQPLELLAIIGLGLNEDLYAEMFESLEISVKYTIGKVAYYLGYYMQADATDVGGLGKAIAKEWLDADVAGATKGTFNETGAIYFRGTLSL